MGRPIYIEKQVKDAIGEHVRAAVERACDGFTSAQEDEDTLTGHLGGLLRIGQQSVHVLQGEIRGEWKWSINYYKFRGRGADATESLIGADGIFELKVDRGFQTETKCLLFQAKKNWSSDSALFGQALKLSTWREAAFVLNYTPEAYEGFYLDDVVRSRGKKPVGAKSKMLSELVGRDFPNCTVGDADLYYDANQKKLVWKDYRGEVVATRFAVKHRIKVEVQAPRRGDSKVKADKELTPAEVHLHRMNVSAEETLSVSYSAEENAIKEAHKLAALAYHPDRLGGVDELLRQIASRRMQEANDAKEALLKKKSRE